MSAIIYTGSGTAVQAPAPQPGAGTAVTVSIPTDTDGGTWSNAYQAFKVLADAITFLNKLRNGRLPVTPNPTTARMFSAVVHTGTGSGTVAPASTSSASPQPIGLNLSYVIKITLAGAVGTAKFQISFDGGLTFSSDTTTAATFTDGNGVVMVFSGTFDFGDIYAFSPADYPLGVEYEASGKTRSLVDHNGYRMGRVSEVQENWLMPLAAAGAQTVTVGGAFYLDQSANCNAGTAIGGGNGNPYVQVGSTSAGVVALNRSTLRTGNYIVKWASSFSLVAEWEMALSQNNTGFDFTVGFKDTLTGTPNATDNGAYFRLTAFDAGVWACATGDGAAQSLASSGVGISLGASQRAFRLELHGSASKYGVGIARFFIGGSCVAELTTHQPTIGSNLYFIIAGTCTTNSTPNQINVGPVRICWNRLLSGVPLI